MAPYHQHCHFYPSTSFYHLFPGNLQLVSSTSAPTLYSYVPDIEARVIILNYEPNYVISLYKILQWLLLSLKSTILSPSSDYETLNDPAPSYF